MRFSDTIRLSLQNLGRAKFRSFLTILGVVIGISAIVAFVSLGIGLQKITTNQIASITALTTLTVNQTPASTSMEAGPKIDDKLIKKISKLKGVKRSSESVNLPTSVESGETSAGAIVYGIRIINSDLETSVISNGKNLKNSTDAVISSALAKSFSQDQESLIGKEIQINILKNSDGLDYQASQIKFNIVGIDNNETTSIVFVPLDQLYKAGSFNGYSSLKVQVHQRKEIAGVKNSVKAMGYQVSTIEDLIEQVDKIFLLIEIILGFVGGIGLLVSFLGIINTMTIAFLERTREIGIMKAIGARRGDIRKLFIFESLMIGFLGGLGGVAVAVGTGDLINFVVNSLIKNSGQRLDLFVMPICFCGVMIVTAMIVSTLAGIYPTWRAQRLSVIDAIRQ